MEGVAAQMINKNMQQQQRKEHNGMDGLADSEESGSASWRARAPARKEPEHLHHAE